MSRALNGLSRIGPAQVGSMKVDVQMTLRDAPGLQAYAAAVGDPSNGLYRHFLTPDEIGARFGANDADWKAAIAYFKSAGLQVVGWRQKSVLRVVGPQAKVEQAFGTTFAFYNGPSGKVLGPTTTPHFATPLAVHSVTHLVYSPKWMKRNSIVIPPHGATPAFDFGFAAQQIADAFDYSGAYRAGFTGTGINIGVIATGPMDPADYAAYKNVFNSGWTDGTGAVHATTNTIQQVNVGTNAANQVGGSPTATPPPVTAPCGTSLPACNPEDGEAQIDTQQTASLAPTAQVLFYLAYVPDEFAGTQQDFGPQIGISEVNDEVQQAIDDNTADVISISYGIAEQYSDYRHAGGITYDPNGTEPTQFAMLQAEGIAVFASSGDAGAEGCARPFDGTGPGIPNGADSFCVSAPAVDQNVTSVGGITAPIDESGRKIGPFTTWGVQTARGFGATGGGVSIVVPRPSWQTGPGVTGSFRNQPDASLDADPVTGVATFANISFGGGPFAIGGTSVAAPQMAAMWALVLDACKQTAACTSRGTGAHPYRLGNAGPYFYRIYNNSTLYPATFLDIVDGNNGVTPCLVNPGQNPGQVSPCPNPTPSIDPGFNASIGYDMTTGIGVPFARHLIKAVVGV